MLEICLIITSRKALSFKDLGGFLRRLEEEEELRWVAEEADPVQEIAEITDRVRDVTEPEMDYLN